MSSHILIISFLFGSTFWHPSPQQSPPAATQYNPFYLHEQFIEHGFFDVRLHLQRTKFSRSPGAGG